MQLYKLDSTFVKTADPLDGFISLIWTERYNQYGDVNLKYAGTDKIASLINEGDLLYVDGSREVCIVESISTEEGVVTATGPTLAGFLQQRMLRDRWQTDKDSWAQTGAAGTIANNIVTQMCITGGIMAGAAVVPVGAPEVIPGLAVASPPSGTSIQVAIPYGNVYDAVKTVCDLDQLGFTLYPPSIFNGTGALTFLVYRGLDRTTGQSTNGQVIFESALDSFTNIKGLRSIAGYKNVAYAWAQGMTAQSSLGIAYAPGFVSSTAGLTRRTLMVEASDVNAADYTALNLKAVLDQKAKDALANNNYVKMTDGQIVPQSAFVYGTDYNLGDVIELRDSGVAQNARIVEYIRTEDATGETAYPTLSVV